jgi:predicted nucleic acid-binding protein
MISFDTNILFTAMDCSNPSHATARQFLDLHMHSPNICICEQVLMELYSLLRNPSARKPPMSAAQAVDVIQQIRSHPCWRIVDVQPEPPFMNEVWKLASAPWVAYRKIYDLRIAKTLQQHGVTDFATCSLKDFQSIGFKRVWNPLASPPP